MFPVRRGRDLLVREVGDETLVYDRKTHKAHCLNRAAAIVWKHCDGRTSVRALAALLHNTTGVPADDDMIQLALSRLHQRQLLQTEGPDRPTISRRELVRKLGIATVLAPLIITVAAPVAVAATSITMAACIAESGDTCPSLPCSDVPGKFCTSVSQGNPCACV